MNKQIITKTFLIAGGNSTLLIWSAPNKLRNNLVDKNLNKVEQIGFVDNNRLTLMGNELCVNGTIAFASTLSSKGKFNTSGVDDYIEYKNVNGLTSIRLNITLKQEGDIVIFPGIGYLCTNKRLKITKPIMLDLASMYNLPAFGVVFYKNNYINPTVYVKQTNSLIDETACGSGSIAVSLITGYREIIQPTGGKIFVDIRNENITVSAEVTEENSLLSSNNKRREVEKYVQGSYGKKKIC